MYYALTTRNLYKTYLRKLNGSNICRPIFKNVPCIFRGSSLKSRQSINVKTNNNKHKTCRHVYITIFCQIR